MKYKIQIGDLFVDSKKSSNLFYINGINKQQTEFMVYWFDDHRKHSFYSEDTLKMWIDRGIYSYFPVIE
jgi:hypothetical protein